MSVPRDNLIRAMRPDDALGVAEVHATAWRAAYWDLLPRRYLATLQPEPLARRWRRRIIRRPSNHRWVLKATGRIWAYITAGPSRSEDIGDGFAGEIFELYVHPDAQRMGMGRALLDRSWEGLEAGGYLWGVLWVLEANAPAQRFYERQGLRRDGTRRPSGIGGRRLPCVRYARPLNAIDPFG